MTSTTKSSQDLGLPVELIPLLRCPGCPDVPLDFHDGLLVADHGSGRSEFPVVDGTPILIDEDNSIFRIAEIAETRDGIKTGGYHQSRSLRAPRKIRRLASAITPPLKRNVAEFDISAAVESIVTENPPARILVLGAGDMRLEATGDACVVYSDVTLRPGLHLVADAQGIPFADASFDAVFAVAMLEHVVDPYACVAEIQRVLVPGGRVYAQTPFMTPVHMGPYDFTRFTAVGHRRLFRWFDEEKAGVYSGPGSVVVWSLDQWFGGWSERSLTRSLLRGFSRFIGVLFLIFEQPISRRRGAFDCAASYYFFGRLRSSPVPDREILETYRGMM